MPLTAAPARLFASDNFSGVHPVYLEAIAHANEGHTAAYGGDPHTQEATALFRDLCGLDVEVLFTFGGTGANVVALSCLLGRAESVLCTSWAHINVDETGAPERFLGVKLQDVASDDARLRPADIAAAASALGNVHHVQPGVVSITQATEFGTLYAVDEVAALCAEAHRHGMRVHLDGARIANAVAAIGGGRDTFRALTFGAGVDAVSFGGTKNGMLGAEVVLLRPGLAEGRAEHLRKQAAQLPSKMRYPAAQFVAALRTDLWIETARHANEMAHLLYSGVGHLASLKIGPPAVNSLYPVLSPAARAELQAWSFFWDWDLARGQVRWMTSWDTEPEDVQLFTDGVQQVVGA
ncbi:MAG: threonine aldolase family protein [Acidimicrobiales bacterium]